MEQLLHFHKMIILSLNYHSLPSFDHFYISFPFPTSQSHHHPFLWFSKPHSNKIKSNTLLFSLFLFTFFTSIYKETSFYIGVWNSNICICFNSFRSWRRIFLELRRRFSELWIKNFLVFIIFFSSCILFFLFGSLENVGGKIVEICNPKIYCCGVSTHLCLFYWNLQA